jgi:hypothetical protein
MVVKGRRLTDSERARLRRLVHAEAQTGEAHSRAIRARDREIRALRWGVPPNLDEVGPAQLRAETGLSLTTLYRIFGENPAPDGAGRDDERE